MRTATNMSRSFLQSSDAKSSFGIQRDGHSGQIIATSQEFSHQMVV